MHSASLLLSLFAVDFIGTATPGPAFVGITQISARHGLRYGLAATAGLVVACWAFCAIVLSGLTVLFEVMPWLYGGLRLAGGLYLIWVGIQFLRSGSNRTTLENCAPITPSLGRSFRKGMVIGFANPKAMVYFASIFTLFLGPDTPFRLAVAAVGIVTFDVLVWFGLVSVLFSRPPVRHAYERMRICVERLAGALMVAFGARLVLARD